MRGYCMPWLRKSMLKDGRESKGGVLEDGERWNPYNTGSSKMDKNPSYTRLFFVWEWVLCVSYHVRGILMLCVDVDVEGGRWKMEDAKTPSLFPSRGNWWPKFGDSTRRVHGRPQSTVYNLHMPSITSTNGTTHCYSTHFFGQTPAVDSNSCLIAWK